MVLYVTKPPLAPGECSNTRFTSDAPPAHRPILSASTYIATPSASPPPFLSLDVARFRPPNAAPPMPLFHVRTRARATVHHAPYPVFADGYRFFFRRLNFSSPRLLSTRPALLSREQLKPLI